METTLNHHSHECRPVDGQSGPQGRVLSCTDSVSSPQVPEISLARTDLSVSGTAVRPVLGSAGLHQGASASHCMAQEAGDSDFCLHARHPDSGVQPSGGRVGSSDCSPNVDAGRLYNQPEEIRPDTGTGFDLHWTVVSDVLGADFSAGGHEGCSDLLCPVILQGGLLQASTSVSTSGSHCSDLAGCAVCSPVHETGSVVPERLVVESFGAEPSGIHEC